MSKVRFIETYRQSPSSEPTKHWTSTDGQFTVSRFVHKKLAGVRDHSFAKPSYSVYHHSENSKSQCIGTCIKTWSEVITTCERYLQNAR